MTTCNCCPRKCNVDRPITKKGKGNMGYCSMPLVPFVARAGLHHWEEPCISGEKGSGTVFFSGCNLHCVYCQNYEISVGNKGKEVIVPKLREIYQQLIAEGAHNINLVTPTHFVDAVAQSLADPLPVPVVYNTGSYELPESLELLRGKVQIYLPDLKYYTEETAIRYSNAPNYFAIATKAIETMFKQVGPYKLDDKDMLVSGVVIRHLILPGHVEETKRIIDWVAGRFKPGEVLFSLMHQYVPCGRAQEFPEITRKLTEAEYQEAEDYLMQSTIEDGFIQEGEAADEKFIPAFDYTGLSDV